MKDKVGVKVSIFCLIRCFFVSFIIFSAISLAVFSYIQTNYLKSQAKRTVSKEASLLVTQGERISGEFSEVISDLTYLKHQFESEYDYLKRYDNIEMQWKVFINSKRVYHNVRFIDVDGDEQIRINLENGIATIESEKDLIRGIDSKYFTLAKQLNENEIYISKVTLCKGKDKINYPYKPIVVLSTPIYDGEKLIGVLSTSYLAETMLSRFNEFNTNFYGDVWLVNPEGYWLNSSRAWGFIFDEKMDDNIGNIHSVVWTKIANGERTIDNEEGVFVVNKLDFTSNIHVKGNFDIKFEDKFLYIISHIDSDIAYGQITNYDIPSIVYKSLIVNKYKFLLIALISSILSAMIYKSKKSYSIVKYLSEHDGFTDILNRRSGKAYLKKLIHKNECIGRNLCICFMDIDGLKCVNDNYGHDKGDELIYSFVNCVKTCIRRRDLFIRLGGDEFLIAIDDADISEGKRVIDRINQEIDLVNQCEDRNYNIRVSFGLIDISSVKNTDIEYLIKLADQKMYDNKEANKAKVEILEKNNKIVG